LERWQATLQICPQRFYHFRRSEQELTTWTWIIAWSLIFAHLE
jgi:hypothetical protein